MSSDRSGSAQSQRISHAPYESIKNLLGLKEESDSNKSRAESNHSYKEKFNETKAQKILKAEKFVSNSGELNQLVTLLLCDVLKQNKRLQHLDLTSTNLPSHTIIHLCNRLRKSRSICSVHFTDNPGLEETTLESTIHQMLKCKPKGEPKIKIDVNK